MNESGNIYKGKSKSKSKSERRRKPALSYLIPGIVNPAGLQAHVQQTNRGFCVGKRRGPRMWDHGAAATSHPACPVLRTAPRWPRLEQSRAEQSRAEQSPPRHGCDADLHLASGPVFFFSRLCIWNSSGSLRGCCRPPARHCQGNPSPAALVAASHVFTALGVPVPAQVRLQTSYPRPYNGALDCIASTFQREGPRAFYKGAPSLE